MNFKHLHYFWAAAKAGGIARASEQLHITPQTLSGQIKLLEQRLNCHLFQKSGRGVELTPEGRTAMSYADQIFALGAELETALGNQADGSRTLSFRVGIADAVPKSIAYRLLEPALAIDEHVRLICHEGQFRDLLGQLSVHRLDLVIADEAMGRQTSVKAFNHPLGTTAMSFFATQALRKSLRKDFPKCLDGAPMLTQGSSSAMRQRLELWLIEHGLRPRMIGEFDDAALLKAFGGEGRGVFMTPTVLEDETCTQYGVEVLG
ncbi:MAG: LysR family transcriptional regulator, partial [Gammaproteobacteria bacterium]|nr:LysR family transcriptional regulator [Gammaproteobacteria bacterium]